MSEVEAIRAEAERLQISRLAHFTPLRNLVHIATGDGVSSTVKLSATARAVFHPQDLARLDGYPDHISCSIQYPNAYYLAHKRRDARGEERIFRDWVCLLIAPDHLWREQTLLCSHNAAGFGGTNVRAGLACFQSMFADEVVAPQATWRRQAQPDCCPTDAQAEVLVHRHIPIDDIVAFAVETAEQAGDTCAVLRQLKVAEERLRFVIAPDFYAPQRLVRALHSGRLPVETPWHPEPRALATAKVSR
jgi:hypothetical protein